MEITVRKDAACGTPRIYPVCAKALAFTALTRTSCLSPQHLSIIEGILDITVIVQTPEIDTSEGESND